MNIPGKRLILGSAVAVAALGIGGVAYAAGNDPEPAPEQGYAVIEDGATTPSPSQQSPSTQSNGREDCPEKNGAGSQGSEGQGQGEQPSEQNPAGNA